MVTSLACCLIVGVSVPADAVPAKSDPSAEEVAEARSKARERSKQLSTTTVLVAEAQATLERLVAQAERVVETYNGELVKTARAKKVFEQASERAAGARAQMEEAREAVAAITAQSYGGMNLTQPMMAMAMAAGIGGGTDPGYLRHASLLSHMGGGQAETLKRLREAQEVFAILQSQAENAYVDQRKSAKQADAARTAAEEAVAEQIAETRRIEEEQARLKRLADAARSTAERLAREEQEGFERARLARERADQEKYRDEAVAREAERTRAAAREFAPHWTLDSTLRSSRGDIAADWALTQLDKPYVWAADGPHGYDCSGLAMRAWEQVGVKMDHWTGTQWTSGPHVRLSRLHRGDLMFFGRITRNPGDIYHVGIYIGRGLMVHAPQTGDVVRVAPIWRTDLIGATRPV